MATTSETSPGNNTNATQAAGQLKAALTSADSRVGQGVQTLELVHRARLASATRTANAMQAQYGADDPRVKTAQAAVTARRTTIGRISLVRLQFSAPQVEVSANGWALQGRVVDAQMNPAARYTVFLVDAKKTYQQQYGFTYTDDTGYFLINYSGEMPAPAPVASSQAAAPQLFIEVVDTSANPVYLSTAAFQPASGSTTFQNIVLPAGDQPIGDPPEAIRKVAIPKEGETSGSTQTGGVPPAKGKTKPL